jgi:hypothetical protein
MTDPIPSGPIEDPISRFITEDQDRDQVARVYEKLEQLLTSGETVLYIAVQKPVTFDPTPEIVALTNRRFMHYRQNVLGRAQFTDYIWRDLKEARLEEGVMRATLTLYALNGEVLRVDNLIKEQARRLYSICQEMEENVREELRLRTMEEKRAAAGGVILHGAGVMGAMGSSAAPAEEPVQALSKLKQLMEAGLVTAEEYEAKKKEILARL